jgi:predicted MFS family arabinose efflux permease
VALALSVAMMGMIWARWPTKGAMEGRDAPSGLSLRAALAEMANPALGLRILALGAVSAGGTAYWAVMGLALTPATGTGGHAALYAGLVAGLEVPFMLALPLLPRWKRANLIAIGTVLYVVHLVGIPLLANSPFLWLLLIPGAAGGALTLTLPIVYLQDQLSERPGTAAALMALMKVVGDGLAAGSFALGTSLSGYTLAAVLAAAVTLAGAGALVLADAKRRT